MLRNSLSDFFDEAWCLHLWAAGERMRQRLLQCVPDAVLVDCLVSVAPVNFGRDVFRIDPNGVWSVIAPCRDEWGDIVDVAAFHPQTGVRATLNGSEFCIGLDALQSGCLDMHGRVPLHVTVWEWLKAECCGLLPIDWRRTALHLHSLEIAGVLVGNVPAGRIAEQRLALKSPPIFVYSEQAIT